MELFCAALDRVDLIHDDRFNTSYKRTQNHADLEPLLFEAMRTKTTAEWIAILEPYGMAVGPLNTIGQAVHQEQIQHREMIVEVEHPRAGRLKIANSPLKLSRTPGRVRGAAPLFAQDTRGVLRDLLGLDEQAIDDLVDAGAVLTEGGPDIAAYLQG